MYNKPKTPSEIRAIKQSGRMLATVLKKIEKELSSGMNGLDVDRISIRELKKLGGTPAFLGYQGFPATICISANDAVVHGIPNKNIFKDGDIVGFDYGVIYKGMVTDAARTFIVGEVDQDIRKLVEETKKSLDASITTVKNGATVGDISAMVQKVLDKSGYGIVRDLVGHGVGHQIHEDPEIPNYGRVGTGPILKTGMTIAIEPMATMGDWQVTIDSDGWTILTKDGSLSAHFEDTVLVTESGSEVLTRL